MNRKERIKLTLETLRDIEVAVRDEVVEAAGTEDVNEEYLAYRTKLAVRIYCAEMIDSGVRSTQGG